MSMAWVGVAVGVASIGTQVYGMSQQAKATDAAAQANYNAAASQRQVLMAGADMDKITAGSRWEAAQTYGALADINAQVKFEASVNHAELGRIAAQDEALQTRAAAVVSSLHAQSTIIGLEAAADIDRNNALLAETSAQASLLQGGQAETESRVKYAEAKANETLRLARGNIALDEGSALAVRAGIDVMSENQAIQIQQKAVLAAFGHRVAEQNYLTDAGAKESQAGVIGEASTLQTDLSNARANFIVSLGNANADLATSLASAGLSNDKAMISLSVAGASVDFNNAVAAADTKHTFAESIDPAAAGAAAMLGGYASLAQSGSNLLGSAFNMWKSFGGFSTTTPASGWVSGYDLNMGNAADPGFGWAG